MRLNKLKKKILSTFPSIQILQALQKLHFLSSKTKKVFLDIIV